jgi:DNA-3-methyladenine glycosylase
VSAALDPRERDFYARSVHDVARDLVGCVLWHDAAAGRIVEVESYHQEEPACHAFIGPRPRTEVLFGAPGHAYVYRSYGIHALLNAVAEEDGCGAAVLIRALEPLAGVDLMRERRGLERFEELCNGPGKLTQALAIELDMNGVDLIGGPLVIEPHSAEQREPEVVTGERIGITKAADLLWRFCDATSRCVSRPWPAAMRREPRAGRASRSPAIAR